MAHRSQEAQLIQAAKWIQKVSLWFLQKPASLNSYAVGIRKVALNASPMGSRDLRRRPSLPL